MILRSRIRMYPLDDFSPTELTGVLIYRFMGRLRFPTAALDFELTMKWDLREFLCEQLALEIVVL